MKENFSRLFISLLFLCSTVSCVAPAIEKQSADNSVRQAASSSSAVSPTASQMRKKSGKHMANKEKSVISQRDIVRQSLLENPLQRGERLAIEFAEYEQPLIKQVIAIEGDKVFIKRGELWVNGKVVAVSGQTYIIPKEKQVLLGKQLLSYNNQIPQDQFIAFSDEHKRSYDSSDYGLGNLDQIVVRLQPAQD
jgi:signal peptidase I